jgi:hypothetical protein
VRHLRAALRSPAIRRVVVAFALFNFAEWATWVAVLVYAVAGHARSRTAAEAVVAERLGSG